MHILHVITTISRGGAENHLISLIEGQISTHRITVAYLKGDGYWKDRLESIGAEVLDLGMKHYLHLSPAKTLHGWIKARRPTLVHAHLPPAELFVRIALMGLSNDAYPMVITKHVDGPLWNTIGSDFPSIKNWISRRSRGVIAISRAVEEYFTRTKLALPNHGIVTVHYGLASSEYDRLPENRVSSIRREWGIGDDTVVYGTVARLVPQKSLDTLLEAFSMVKRSSERKVKLVLVGTGRLEAELKALAIRLGIADLIVWAGFREDIPAVMSAFDVFVLSSIYEGFGLVLLEAMAASRPIIASRVSAIPEIVDHGKTGYLVPPKDSASLSHAMLELLDQETRKRCGMEGRQRMSDCFSIEKMVKETENFYHTVLST